MPTKAEMYSQMADKVATQLVGSWKEWTAFLTTAARLYKYPFHEQMMIYAQRPDATACAEYDLWNEKMGRYVRRGSKGIALVDDSGDKPRLRYVFDISDTGTREHSRTPWLWQLEEQHIGPVSAMLERSYGVAGDDLAQQLTDVAGKLASEYWDEHQRDFRYIVDGSFLAEYDDYNIEVQFKSAATVSIAYALMSRCGLDTEQYFQHEDFMPIFDFNRKQLKGGDDMKIVISLLKLILKIVAAPVVVVLTVAIWMCVGIVYVSGLVLGLISMVITVLGVAVLITYSPQNGIILLVIAFLLSPFGLPQLAFWLLGKVQDLKFVIQDLVYG